MTLDRDGQAEELQLRGVELMGKAAYLFGYVLDLVWPAAALAGMSRPQLARDRPSGAHHLYLEHRQRLTDVVMQLPGDAGAFGLLRVDQAPGDLLAGPL